MSHHTTDRPMTDPGIDDLAERLADQKRLMKMGEPKAVDYAMEGQRLELIQKAKAHQLEEALGPTGDFPAGRMVKHDEGGIMMGITTFNGRVVIDFGTQIRSVGFTRNEALDLARLLRQRAKECPQIIGEQEPEA